MSEHQSDQDQQGWDDPHEDPLFASSDVNVGSRAPMSNGGQSGRKPLWLLTGLRDKSSKRMVIIIGIIVVGGLTYTVWPSHHLKVISAAPIVPSLSVAQGSAAPSVAYNRALTNSDNQRAQAALTNGTSALPTMVMPAQDPTTGTTNLPSLENPTPQTTPASGPIIPSGPAGAATASSPAGATGAAIPKDVPKSNVVVADANRVEAISQWMDQLDVAPQAAEITDYAMPQSTTGDDQGDDGAGMPGNRAYLPNSDSAYNTGLGQGTGQALSAASSALASAASSAAAGPYAVPAPGTILYSQMRSAVNSDDPGPVLAEIVQGPLAGARLLGSFQTHPDGVVLSFNTMTIPYQDANGETQTQTLSISTVAVSSSNLSDSMATSVNNHLALRLGVTFVTSLLGNFGNLLAESGANTTVTGTGDILTSNPLLSTSQEAEAAAGQAAGTAGQIINQAFGNMAPTIKVAAGTPFGLLFTSASGQ